MEKEKVMFDCFIEIYVYIFCTYYLKKKREREKKNLPIFYPKFKQKKKKKKKFILNMCNASRPLLRCRPRAQYEVHELPLFVEKSRSCRVVQECALVQHEQVASKKNSLHEHTRALYVIATRRLFYDELNASFQLTYFLRRHPSP